MKQSTLQRRENVSWILWLILSLTASIQAQICSALIFESFIPHIVSPLPANNCYLKYKKDDPVIIWSQYEVNDSKSNSNLRER